MDDQTPANDLSKALDFEQCSYLAVFLPRHRLRPCAMPSNHTDQRKKLRDELAKLRAAAIAELERRGYDVRGKTATQIRQLLKRRPSKRKLDNPFLKGDDQ